VANEEYQYVHVMYEFMIGKQIKRLKWATTERIELEDIDEWIAANPDKRAYFYTIQTFSNSVRTEGEVHWSPMYFDMDSDDPILSLYDARKLVKYFLEKHSINPQVWFSGNRGFHILVDGLAFGATPSDTLTYSWRHIAERIKETQSLVTLDDTVYSYPRMWRIENTPNPKQGFLKVALTIEELNTLDIGDIISLASSPRNLEIPQQEIMRPVESLVRLFDQTNQVYEERQKIIEESLDKEYTFDESYPECVKYLLDNGLALLGTKNRADMALAGFLKSYGVPIQEAINIACKWAEEIPTHLTHVHNKKTRSIQTRAVVVASYSDEKYRFSCGSILTCGMKVDCDSCPVKEVKPIAVSLGDHSLSDYMGKKIITRADAIGSDSVALLVPGIVTATCKFNPDTSKCILCPQQYYYNAEAARNERTIKFDASNPKTVALLDVNQRDITQKMITLFGIHNRCLDFNYEIKWINAMGVYISTSLTDFSVEESIGRVRVIYFGHKLKLNATYSLVGYVHPHPRTMQATFLVKEATPMSSTLSNFILSKTELNALVIFQPSSNQTPLEKIAEIHSHFIADFMFIFGREDLIMGVDLVYHSVRRMNLQRRLIKGWLDILIIGDTRQGKTETIKQLMGYYGLGTVASGESSSRTGLLYNIQMIQGQDAWIQYGLLCRANGLLVAVDEVHGMKAEDFKAFTDARSEGIVNVTRYAWGSALAETRLISICNPREEMSMESYGFPIMAIPDIPIFTSKEDISRFDYAVGVMAGEIDDDVLHTNVNDIQRADNPYTKTLCKNLILWIWTRKPKEIVITSEVEKYILKRSIEFCADWVADIPLVESADQRLKITRIAAAIAGRTYSTEDGVHLLVQKHHIDDAIAFLYKIYKSPSLDYYEYSIDKAKTFIDDEDMENLVSHFTASFGANSITIAAWCLSSNTFQKSTIKISLNLESSEVDQLMSLLISNKFIDIVWGSKYRKTPMGRKFFRIVAKQDVSKIPSEDLDFSQKEDDF